ncbi:MAG: YicC/YloC family endoribonuclease [Gammaproteobacteria bacterium]|nr:YicC/YloC family endoribonuclease [Gammaproteobacteria bacterium]
MTSSMTGFARREQRGEWGNFAWELRSVNHRYLEVGMRLPEEFRQLETAIRERINAKLGRGKVDVGLRWDKAEAEDVGLEINLPLVRQLRDAHQQLDKVLGHSEGRALGAMDVLRWPGVLREAERDLEPLHAAALDLLDAALDDLVANRQAEGERIAVLLEDRAASVQDIVGKVRERIPVIKERLRERLDARLAEVSEQPDQDRLEQELVYQAQKLDVDEELDRLESHVTELRDALKRDEPVGRRLDFLMQEFNREANTLGSKSQDTETTRASVDLKVLIEQMREQIQNIE